MGPTVESLWAFRRVVGVGVGGGEAPSKEILKTFHPSTLIFYIPIRPCGMDVPTEFIQGIKTQIPSILTKATTASEDYGEEVIVTEWP